MPNYNKVILIGHLTRDPEPHVSTGGTSYVRFGVAVNNGYGEKRKPCFIDCTAFKKTGETIVKHFSKGSAILVEGALEMSTWEKDGVKRTKHSLTVFNMEFVGSPKKKAADIEDDDLPF